MWDILGKALGVPVHVVLGRAVHSRLPMYESGGVPTFTIDQLVQQAKAVREAGFLGYKMRANFFAYHPEVEAERVGAVRAAVGPDMALALDAVQSFNFHPWSVKQVAAMLERLAPYGLAWAEKMLPPFDPSSAVKASRSRVVLRTGLSLCQMLALSAPTGRQLKIRLSQSRRNAPFAPLWHKSVAPFKVVTETPPIQR